MLYLNFLTISRKLRFFVIGTLGLSCTPSVQSGFCDADELCNLRGQVCDLDIQRCVDAEVDTSTTESQAPASFSSKTIAFHRGQVCSVQQAQSGGFVPIQLDPCLHPCLQVTGFNHRHYFECRGSQCEAAALMWVTASATDCPPDAFSGFDRSQCTYGNAVDIALDTTTETGAIEGSMLLEIPFFTNSDAEAMANAGGDIGTIKEIVNEYPRQEDRIVGGTPIQILPGNPAASQSCAMGGCSCFEIGF